MKSDPAQPDLVDSEKRREPAALPGNPRIIPRSAHNISRKDISDHALKVLYRLRNLGFKAYLVGGGVRDLYLGKTPKDFDVGTDARPTRLKKVFRNCRIIGRRFRIAHVFFPDDELIEVATFRQGEVHAVQKGDGVILLDNQYGTPEEDARRRDLTINGLFYDIDTFAIIDYVGGVEDLENRIVRTIRDPDESFQEDPVRMVRALRHAARTGFTIAEETLRAIYRNRLELRKANPSRLMEEIFKDLRAGAALSFFKKLTETHLLDAFLPTLAEQIREHGLGHPLIVRLDVLDRRAADGRELSNAVLLAALVHTVLMPDPENWTGEGPHPPGVWSLLQSGFRIATEHLRISRRDSERVAQVVLAFRRLRHFVKHGQLSLAFQKKSYLAEALDFVALDLEAHGEDTSLVEEWREVYAKDRSADEERRRWRMKEARRRSLRRRRRGGSSGSASSRGKSQRSEPGREAQGKKAASDKRSNNSKDGGPPKKSRGGKRRRRPKSKARRRPAKGADS